VREAGEDDRKCEADDMISLHGVAFTVLMEGMGAELAVAVA
jgi:hypothetical protein